MLNQINKITTLLVCTLIMIFFFVIEFLFTFFITMSISTLIRCVRIRLTFIVSQCWRTKLDLSDESHNRQTIIRFSLKSKREMYNLVLVFWTAQNCRRVTRKHAFQKCYFYLESSYFWIESRIEKWPTVEWKLQNK